jgi:tetratricopeptide (TPR) repeat protein
LAPLDPVVLQSLAITALGLAAGLRRGDDDRRRLVTIARRASTHAVELDETDADLCYAYGSALYADDDAEPEEALEAFDAALARDPAHAWSLYRAHCLHDLERWSEAADAYARVKHSDFVGHRAWRMELLREQRASCLLHAGRVEEGIALAEDVVRRRERALACGGDWLRSPALHESPRLLVQAAASGWLPDELRARLEATLTANDERFLLDEPEG